MSSEFQQQQRQRRGVGAAMDVTPIRAPFLADEDCKPLRTPKSLMNNTQVGGSVGVGVGGGVGVGVGSHNMAVGGAYPLGAGGETQASYVGHYQTALPLPTDPYAPSVSPSNLSPFAKEFVPRPAAQQDQHPQQSYQQQFQQPQHHQPQQNRQPRYVNGYHQQQQQQQQQQQHQQQQQLMYASQMPSLIGSVQDRLNISGGGGGGGGGGGSGGGGASSSSSGNGSASSNYYQQQRVPHQHNLQQQQQQQQKQQQQQQHHHQQPHHQRNNKQYHQQQQLHQQRFQQQHQQQQQQQQQAAAAAAANANGGGSGDVECIALEYLQTVIQCLNQNPGQFDTIATRFLTIFDGMENNQFVLANAMENIFIESIKNPNFRYMGAKLYNLLHMLNLKKDSLFHELLKYKLDYHQKEVVEYMETKQQQKVRETALFLAELYMQLRGDDSRIHLIAENILYSLQQLLTKESPDNVRCICLTLKLAGYDLTSDCPVEMATIIGQLDEINVKFPGKYPLAANVISLQKNNWGRKIQSSKSDPELSKPPEPLRISDEPIFYGPDGKELTAEEAAFLCDGIEVAPSGRRGACSDDDEDDDDDDDIGDVDLDPEMDEETERAYKEFCKQKGNA